MIAMMADRPVTQADLDRQTNQLRAEIHAGDEAILKRFGDHLHQHENEHTRIESWMLRMEGKQDALLAQLTVMDMNVQRRMGRDDLFWKMALVVGPLLAVVFAWYLRG